MPLSNDITTDIQSILTKPWNTRRGQKVPSSDDVALGGGAVELDATFLYADLANSSRMANELDRRVTAKVLKAFLGTTARLVRYNKGAIVSFDGDRILGVFVGDFKNSAAVRCALQINYVVHQEIAPVFLAKYESLETASIGIGHGVGVDTGLVLAVRAGARGGNDLIWIGRAPNLAAKLSDLREAPYHTLITGDVYRKLAASSKFSSDKVDMWEPRTWEFNGARQSVYRSSYHWKP